MLRGTAISTLPETRGGENTCLERDHVSICRTNFLHTVGAMSSLSLQHSYSSYFTPPHFHHSSPLPISPLIPHPTLSDSFTMITDSSQGQLARLGQGHFDSSCCRVMRLLAPQH